MTETQERFLREIAKRLPLDRIAEVHLFPPIRQGGSETGVAVVALLPDRAAAPGPTLSPDDEAGLPDESVGGSKPLLGGIDDASAATGSSLPMTIAVCDPTEAAAGVLGDETSDREGERDGDGERDGPSGSEVEGEIEEERDSETESDDDEDDAATLDSAGGRGAPPQQQYHASPDSEPHHAALPIIESLPFAGVDIADDDELAAEFADPPAAAMANARRWPGPGEAAQAARHTIYSARYRLTLKGADRGKWSVDLVVRGVQRRAADGDAPERLTSDEIRSIVL